MMAWSIMAWGNMTHIMTPQDGMVPHGMGQHDTHHDTACMMAWSIIKGHFGTIWELPNPLFVFYQSDNRALLVLFDVLQQ
jgi:hypothetical protein